MPAGSRPSAEAEPSRHGSPEPPASGRARTAVRLALLAGGLFVVGTNAFVIAGVLPAIAGDLGASQTAVASSITWYAAVVAVASPLVPVAAPPRAARRVLIAVGLLLVAAGTVVAALAPGLPVFVGGRVLAALGGAALVPTATAAAPTCCRPSDAAPALAATGLGFTLASAVGSPAGTALAAVVGWRATMLGLAGLALVLAVGGRPVARAPIPAGAATSLAPRLGVLRDRRVLLVLAAAALVTTGFNVVYIFSAELTRSATGGDGRLLALLLLLYGIGGIVGTGAGRTGDRPLRQPGHRRGRRPGPWWPCSCCWRVEEQSYVAARRPVRRLGRASPSARSCRSSTGSWPSTRPPRA